MQLRGRSVAVCVLVSRDSSGHASPAANCSLNDVKLTAAKCQEVLKRQRSSQCIHAKRSSRLREVLTEQSVG